MDLTENHLLERGIKKIEALGWTKYRKNRFEIVAVPRNGGGVIFCFAYDFESKTEYRKLFTVSDVETIYQFITGKKL